jgi:protein ImuB
MRLVALDEEAGKLGLTRGQTQTDARAMIPALVITQEDPTADARLLTAVAGWAERYTPLVALAPADSLILDITGCAHLFDGEAALLADLSSRLHTQGFATRGAIADTPGAAIAVARYGAPAVLPPGRAQEALRPLPLAALRLEPDTVAAMDRVGLKRIGQIINAPRGPLATRFGTGLIRRLDQALGHRDETINPRRPTPAFIAERRFAEPITTQDDIAATLAALAQSLAGSLEKHGQGARSLEYSLFRVDGFVARITVGAGRPIRAPGLVVDLFWEKFATLGDSLDAGYGFDTARLSVTATASTAPAQIDLSGDAAGETDLAGLIDRIGARLGPAAVQRMTPMASHIPERAVANQPWTSDTASGDAAAVPTPATPAIPAPIDRPLRLFARPEPVEAIAEVPDGPPVRFRWRRVVFHVARAEGPERIASEWWRDEDLTRDYFRVEDATGHRFWLYREGLYGRETATPRWFLHGVFA